MLTRARAHNSLPHRGCRSSIAEGDALGGWPVTATPHPRPVRSLLAALVHAHREARRSSLERTAPASAGSRSFRTGKARQPGPLGTPRGPRARTDHMSRSSPATCRSGAGPSCPAHGAVFPAHHFTSASPAWPFKRSLAPPPLVRADSPSAGHRRRAWAARSGGRLIQLTGAGLLRGRQQPVPINTERPHPLPDTGGAAGKA